MRQEYLKIFTVILITAILWICNEPQGMALQEHTETLQSLWQKSKKNDVKAIGKLADFYIEKGAFYQALSQLEQIACPDTFDIVLLEKVVRAIKGMNKERETISRLSKLETKSLLNESILFQLYLLTNNKVKAVEKVHYLATLDSSPEFTEFLANGALLCLPPGEALPFFERFIETELSKDKPNCHPFLKAAKLLKSVNKTDDALATLEAYLDSFTIVKDFKYPFTNKILTEGYFTVCEEFEKIVAQTSGNLPANPPQPLSTTLDRVMRKVLTFSPESDKESIATELEKIINREHDLGALDHLTLSILFRKSEFDKLYLAEVDRSLSKKLTQDEIAYLSKSLYPTLEPMQVISTHQSSVYYELAQYQNNNGKPLKAINSCKHALIENPRNKKAAVLIEQWIDNPSFRVMANRALREINEIHNNIKLLSILAKSEYSKSDFPKMYDAAHKVFGCAPHNIHALKTYVAACLHKKLGNRAVEACLTAIGHGADDSVWPVLATVAISTGMTVETRIAVKDVVFCHSPLNFDCLMGYLDICDDQESRNEFTNHCKEQIDNDSTGESLILLGTVAATAAFRNHNIPEAKAQLIPVVEIITPSDKAFSKAVELSSMLNLDKFFAESLEKQAETIIGKGSLPYYWEAARIATRGNFQKDGLVYYGKAIDKSKGRPDLEDEFLSFGRTARGFPFFVQGFLEKTSGHYDFYSILGKYYLMRGHKRNSVSFLKLAANHLKHRNDVKLLLGRAICANNKRQQGLKVADKALEGIDGNLNTVSWGIVREALKERNHRVLYRIIRRWTISPMPELRKAAYDIANFGHLENEYLSMLKAEQTASPYALWLPLLRADYAVKLARETKDYNNTFTIFEEALAKAKSTESIFERGSLSLKLATAYFKAIVESKNNERGISVFSSLLSEKNENIELRKLYERLCVLTQREGHLLKSISESMYCFKPLSKKRMDRSRELVTTLFKAGILDIFLNQLPPLSKLTPEEAASQMHLRWCGSLLLEGDSTKTSVIANNLTERLKAQGRAGLPALKELGQIKDALLLIDRLVLRHGEVNKPGLLLEKARLLLSFPESINSGIKVYEEIIDLMPDSKWAQRGQIELLEVLNEHNMFSKSHMYLVDKILASKKQSLREMAAIGQAFIQTESWSRLTRILRQIYNSKALSFNPKHREMVIELLQQVSNSQIQPKHTVLKKSVALVARKLMNPITDPLDSQRLEKIYSKMESGYLNRLHSFSKKGSSKSRGINMYLQATSEGTDSKHTLPDEERITLLKKLIRLRPPVRDIYGNSLTQRGRIALANLLVARGQKDEATQVARNVISDSHHLGPDEPGSCWLEADFIMLHIMYSQQELKLVNTDCLSDSPQSNL